MRGPIGQAPEQHGVGRHYAGEASAAGGLAGILARDLRADMPASLRAILEPGDRALVIIPGLMAIVATDRRVLLQRPDRHRPALAYDYSELTGATAHVGFLMRYVALTGPRLQTSFRFGMTGRSNNATPFQLWKADKCRRGADEMSQLITAMNEARTESRSFSTQP